MSQNRRDFFSQAGAALAAGAIVPNWVSDLTYGASRTTKAKGDRLIVGAIGTGGQGTGIMRNSLEFADLVAICDVDVNNAANALIKARERQPNCRADIYGDYRKILDRQDIDIVTIGTPDHWHTKIAIEAMQAGKDVYCEKPLTLTIDEGKKLIKAVNETGKVLQVGTQQRSQKNLVWLRAVATVRSGQLGKIKKITVSLPQSTAEGGPFTPVDAPKNLDWEQWLGQTPLVGYCKERSHFSFRWWYEYSGGIVTDWGAHHVDIAQWAIGMDNSGPISVDGSKTVMPKIANGYNTPKSPIINFQYASGTEMEIVSGDEFVIFEGEKGRIRVNRGRITGKVIEEQDADKSLLDPVAKLMEELYPVGKPGNHMGNFVDCVKSRKTPISDVISQHRSVSVCHMGNISCRLGRKLTWDPVAEKFVGDDEANTYLSRTQREPYTIST